MPLKYHSCLLLIKMSQILSCDGGNANPSKWKQSEAAKGSRLGSSISVPSPTPHTPVPNNTLFPFQNASLLPPPHLLPNNRYLYTAFLATGFLLVALFKEVYLCRLLKSPRGFYNKEVLSRTCYRLDGPFLSWSSSWLCFCFNIETQLQAGSLFLTQLHNFQGLATQPLLLTSGVIALPFRPGSPNPSPRARCGPWRASI